MATKTLNQERSQLFYHWLKIILSLPILGAFGLYLIVQAQIEWYGQPVFSEKSTFFKALNGVFLIFTQGWVSSRRDWQTLFDDTDTPRHILDTPRWFFAVIGLLISVVALWHGIIQERWFSLPVLIPTLLGIILILSARLPLPFFNKSQQLNTSQFNLTRLLFASKSLIALFGIWLCMYVAWRAVLLDMSALLLLGIWSIGVSLTMIGLVPLSDAKEWVHGVGQSLSQNRVEWFVVLILFLVALLIRTAWLETQPYIQSDDEAAFAIQAVDVEKFSDWIDNPFRYDSWQAHPMLYHMSQLAAIKAFGQTVAAARFPSALMGALTIPAVYLLSRRLFNWRVALASSIFLMSLPVHVHFSRLALNQVGDPFFATLAFAFLTQALRTGNRMEYALAGLTLGLSQYYYGASRIVVFLAVAYIGLYALANLRWLWRRGDAILITAIVAGVVAFPNYYSTVRDTERSFTPRLDHVAIFRTGNIQAATATVGFQDYWESQVSHSFGAYIHRFDKDQGFYGQHGIVSGWYGGILFLVGIGLCLRRIRDPRWLLLPLWIAVGTIFGVVLLIDPPHYTRFVCVLPALSIIVGLALVWMIEKLQDLPTQLGLSLPCWSNPRLQSAPILAATLIIMLFNLADYTFDYLPRRGYFGERTANLNEAADILNAQLDFDNVTLYYLSSGALNLHGSSLMRYQLPLRGFEYDIAQMSLSDLKPGNYAFVAAWERIEDLEMLFSDLSSINIQAYNSPSTGTPLLYILLISFPQTLIQSPPS